MAGTGILQTLRCSGIVIQEKHDLKVGHAQLQSIGVVLAHGSGQGGHESHTKFLSLDADTRTVDRSWKVGTYFVRLTIKDEEGILLCKVPLRVEYVVSVVGSDRQ